jgi:hypothetical protein
VSDDRLAELDRLAAAATPGPWFTGYPQTVAGTFVKWSGLATEVNRDPGYSSGQPIDPEGQVAGMWDYEEGGVRLAADAAFIAAARTAVPELVAEVRRLRAEAVELRARLDARDDYEAEQREQD